MAYLWRLRLPGLSGQTWATLSGAPWPFIPRASSPHGDCSGISWRCCGAWQCQPACQPSPPAGRAGHRLRPSATASCDPRAQQVVDPKPCGRGHPRRPVTLDTAGRLRRRSQALRLRPSGSKRGGAGYAGVSPCAGLVRIRSGEAKAQDTPCVIDGSPGDVLSSPALQPRADRPRARMPCQSPWPAPTPGPRAGFLETFGCQLPTR